MGRLVKEATEIGLHSNNFNRDNGFMLSQSWNPLTSMLQKVISRQSTLKTGQGQVSPQSLSSTQTGQ